MYKQTAPRVQRPLFIALPYLTNFRYEEFWALRTYPSPKMVHYKVGFMYCTVRQGIQKNSLYNLTVNLSCCNARGDKVSASYRNIREIGPRVHNGEKNILYGFLLPGLNPDSQGGKHTKHKAKGHTMTPGKESKLQFLVFTSTFEY